MLPTAAVADAAVRLAVPIRQAPTALRPLMPGLSFAGPAVPVTHLGSVDVILEVIDDAPVGAVLVVDNGGRLDEACVGDLMVLEAKLAGFVGIVIWGQHRDSVQLLQIGLPIQSLGANPFGPRRVPPAGRAMRSAFLDGAAVRPDDLVVADDDGVLFLAPDRREEVLELASEIHRIESEQAVSMRSGTPLRTQLDFAGYRQRQAEDPSLTLRQYLVERGNAVET